MRRLAVGQVVYTAICQDSGTMLDDATVFRMTEDNLRLVGGCDGDGPWLEEQADALGLRAYVKPAGDALHNLAVQGPLSRDTLRELVWTRPGQPALDDLKWFRFLIGRLRDRTACRSSSRAPATRASSATRSGAIPTTAPRCGTR